MYVFTALLLLLFYWLPPDKVTRICVYATSDRRVGRLIWWTVHLSKFLKMTERCIWLSLLFVFNAENYYATLLTWYEVVKDLGLSFIPNFLRNCRFLTKCPSKRALPRQTVSQDSGLPSILISVIISRDFEFSVITFNLKL